jgi:hypothetical protein
MSSRAADPPRHQAGLLPRQAAIIAGLAYVAIIGLAGFTSFLVLGRLIEPDDPAATVSNIVHSETLLRIGVAAFIVVLIADVVVAWALYVFFERASRALSLLTAWFRLVYVAIAGAALLNLLVVLQLVDGAGYAAELEAGQRNAQVMLFLDANDYGWRYIGHVFFGVHLLLLGMVIIKSDYAPRILGSLVALAGVGYLVGHLPLVFLPDDEQLFLLLTAVLGVAGEFGLPAWLLLRGGKEEPREAASIHA